MNPVLPLVGLMLLLQPMQAICQGDPYWKEHDGFESVFQNLLTGEFDGTVNGILLVQKDNGSQLILDFQGAKAELNIVEDDHEIYDVSTKIYYGYTTSGKTRIKYETYSWANSISIELHGEWFTLSLIDGAADMAINGIEFLYVAEESTEYLMLRISKKLTLTNYFKDENDESMKKSITLLPESTLVFAIEI